MNRAIWQYVHILVVAQFFFKFPLEFGEGEAQVAKVLALVYLGQWVNLDTLQQPIVSCAIPVCSALSYYIKVAFLPFISP